MLPWRIISTLDRALDLAHVVRGKEEGGAGPLAVALAIVRTRKRRRYRGEGEAVGSSEGAGGTGLVEKRLARANVLLTAERLAVWRFRNSPILEIRGELLERRQRLADAVEPAVDLEILAHGEAVRRSDVGRGGNSSAAAQRCGAAHACLAGNSGIVHSLGRSRPSSIDQPGRRLPELVEERKRRGEDRARRGEER